MDDVEALVRQLLRAKKAYYERGSSSLSDAEFDAREEQLRQYAPQHRYFSKVGYATRGEKITHQNPMLSADKCKNLPELQKWLERLALPAGTEFLIEPKIDGLSASCVYRAGKLLYVATRGDGQQGQDITHITQYMQSIPYVLPQPLDLEVRGELYLPQDTEFDTQGKPLRNNCVGLINRKEAQSDLQYVHFTAYQSLGDMAKSEQAAVENLQLLGFDIVPLAIFSDFIEIESYYQEYLDDLRFSWPYETDGLIIIVNNRQMHASIDARWVVDHHHHYLVAFKPPAEAKDTIVQCIEWNISRQGHLIPVVIFSPIELGGATLLRASLHNAQTVKNMGIVAGDTLVIERANDVIPYVKMNLTHDKNRVLAEDFLPQKCPCCQSALIWAGVHLHCANRNCRERIIQRVLYWVNCCEMENIAEATVRLLFEKELLTSITDLYKIVASQLFLLEGFGEKKVNNFLQEIQKSRNMNIQEFIGRLGISLVQKKALKKLKIFSLEDFWQFNDTTYVIGRNLIAWRDDIENKALVEELRRVLNIVDVDKTALTSQVSVCCTGSGPYPRAELAKVLLSMGYHITDQVSKETQLLLCDNVNGTSSKLIKARKLGIKVQSYEEFFQEKGQLF
ncbi:MAG: BRCT domain-containing protein [Spirochaetia bacterium]